MASLPVTMRTKAGSRAMFVRRLRLLNVSFSVQAHTPMAKMLSPINCKRVRFEPLHCLIGGDQRRPLKGWETNKGVNVEETRKMGLVRAKTCVRK